jgi:hypothetical protein
LNELAAARLRLSTRLLKAAGEADLQLRVSPEFLNAQKAMKEAQMPTGLKKRELDFRILRIGTLK